MNYKKPDSLYSLSIKKACVLNFTTDLPQNVVDDLKMRKVINNTITQISNNTLHFQKLKPEFKHNIDICLATV